MPWTRILLMGLLGLLIAAEVAITVLPPDHKARRLRPAVFCLMIFCLVAQDPTNVDTPFGIWMMSQSQLVE